jgi:S1-C subfamily serine protease
MRPVGTQGAAGASGTSPAPPAEPPTTPAAEAPAPPARRRRVWWVLAAALVVVAGLVAWWAIPSGPPPLTSAEVDKAVQRGLDDAAKKQREAPPDAAVAYRTITPSFVTITHQRSGADPGTTETDLGGGVVVDARGDVLTALHVVAGGGQLTVRFADGTSAAAHVATSRPEHDIAVLNVDTLPQVVVPAVLAGAPSIGDTVFAFGNPIGLERSLSAGVVSANNRLIATDTGAPLDGLIQFDAAVNPGNSGGPLLDKGGQVVGIVTALANPAKQDFFVGIGFAVPIATAAGAAGGPQK